MKRKWQKQINGHYTALWQNEICQGYILFIHGGPGFNSSGLEAALTHIKAYENFPYGIITYDQRGCGRSANLPIPETHHENVQDLSDLIGSLQNENAIKVSMPVGGIVMALKFCVISTLKIQTQKSKRPFTPLLRKI